MSTKDEIIALAKAAEAAQEACFNFPGSVTYRDAMRARDAELIAKLAHVSPAHLITLLAGEPDIKADDATIDVLAALGFDHRKCHLKDVLARVKQLIQAEAELKALYDADAIGAFHISNGEVSGTTDYCLKDGWPIHSGTIDVFSRPMPAQPMIYAGWGLWRQADGSFGSWVKSRPTDASDESITKHGYSNVQLWASLPGDTGLSPDEQ